MYRLIRNTHLILGLSASLMILVYAVSAVQMAHQFAISRTSRAKISGLRPDWARDRSPSSLWTSVATAATSTT